MLLEIKVYEYGRDDVITETVAINTDNVIYMRPSTFGGKSGYYHLRMPQTDFYISEASYRTILAVANKLR